MYSPEQGASQEEISSYRTAIQTMAAKVAITWKTMKAMMAVESQAGRRPNRVTAGWNRRLGFFILEGGAQTAVDFNRAPLRISCGQRVGLWLLGDDI